MAKGFAVLERIRTGKEMLVRIVAMLTKLVERFDPDQYRVRENASGVAQSFEDEDDDEHEDERNHLPTASATTLRSATKSAYAFCLAAGSGARRTEDG